MGNKGNNNQPNKKILWLIAIIIVAIIILIIMGLRKLQTNSTPVIDDNNHDIVEVVEEPSGNLISGDFGYLLDKLSEEDYKIDQNNNTIHFNEDVEIDKFILSDNENGPVSGDIWYDVGDNNITEIPDSEIKKKFVYYKIVYMDAIDCPVSSGYTASSPWGNTMSVYTVYTTARSYHIRVHIGINNPKKTKFRRLEFPNWSNWNDQDDLKEADWDYGTDEGAGWWSFTFNFDPAHTSLDTNDNLYICHVHPVQNNSSGHYDNRDVIAVFNIYYDVWGPTITLNGNKTIYTTNGQVTLNVNVSDVRRK